MVLLTKLKKIKINVTISPRVRVFGECEKEASSDGGTAKNIYWMSIVKYRLRVTNINFRKQREIEEWMRKVKRKKKLTLSAST